MYAPFRGRAEVSPLEATFPEGVASVVKPSHAQRSDSPFQETKISAKQAGMIKEPLYTFEDSDRSFKSSKSSWEEVPLTPPGQAGSLSNEPRTSISPRSTIGGREGLHIEAGRYTTRTPIALHFEQERKDENDELSRILDYYQIERKQVSVSDYKPDIVDEALYGRSMDADIDVFGLVQEVEVCSLSAGDDDIPLIEPQRVPSLEFFDFAVRAGKRAYEGSQRGREAKARQGVEQRNVQAYQRNLDRPDVSNLNNTANPRSRLGRLKGSIAAIFDDLTSTREMLEARNQQHHHRSYDEEPEGVEMHRLESRQGSIRNRLAGRAGGVKEMVRRGLSVRR